MPDQRAFLFKVKFCTPEAGLSLVEVMIAMAISLILLEGLIQLVVSNKHTYLLRQSQSANQENSRFAIHHLEDILQKAGYRALPQDSRNLAYPATDKTTGCPAFSAGQVIAVSTVGKGLCIRYQARNPSAFANETDCSGNNLTSAASFVTRVYYDAHNRSLMCGVQGKPASALVDGIENLHFDFGIDTKGSRTSSKYTVSPAPHEWNDIVSVRISLLTASQADQVASGHLTYRFPLDSTKITTAPDRRLYRSSQRVVSLKNAVL